MKIQSAFLHVVIKKSERYAKAKKKKKEKKPQTNRKTTRTLPLHFGHTMHSFLQTLVSLHLPVSDKKYEEFVAHQILAAP